MRILLKTMCVAALLFLSSAFAQEEARLLRFPTVSDNAIIFTYAGDLYTVPIAGGTARKLTNDVGVEVFARISPDGKNVAFTAQYDGNTEVYVMPSNGGVPKRLTYTATLGRDDVSDRMGPNNIVMCWKDNETVIYRSRQREFNDMNGQLFEVSINGGLSTQLPLPRGGFCSFSPDGKKLAYNRVFREFRTWKRYRGGQADDIWIYDFASKKVENITSNPGQDIIPMWYKDQIFFLSDRDSKLNIYCYDIKSKETKQITTFKEFDCKFPSLNAGSIVFENAGYIYRYDIAAKTTTKVPVTLAEDLKTGRGGLVDASKNIESYTISPDGKRGLFCARGDLFTVPQKNGATRNLTQSSGAHERAPAWSPNGKYIAYISDESGEDQIYIMAMDGSGVVEKLTSDGPCYKYGPVWSPDCKYIMWSDRSQSLFYVDVATKKIYSVDHSKDWEINDYSWAPDSKWISYTLQSRSGVSRVYIYSMNGGKNFPVTDEWFSSSNAAFSSDGKFLFFVSNRNFSPTYSWTEWNHAYVDMAKIYFLPLNKMVKSPFEPKSDEVAIKDTTVKEKQDDKKESRKTEILFDLKNFPNSVIELPVEGSNYFNITAVGNKVYYQRRGSNDERTKLLLYDLDARKETELGDVDSYEISADNAKMMISQRGSYSIIDVPAGRIENPAKLSLSDMMVKLDRQAEWKQIYYEGWRQMRDFFFDPNMHGVDWKAIKTKYEQLLPYVNNRIDLTYIMGEMIGELNCGHSYVGGGDYAKAPRVLTGLLGAQLSRDEKSGYYRVEKILKGANWTKELRSPLTEPGVNVSEGDYIIAVNGKPTNTMNDIFEALVNTAGKQVTLKVSAKSSGKEAHDAVVIPLSDEQELYYYNWVQENIRKVTEATNGQVGYIHIPDMGPKGLTEFVKLYYPQLSKKALIIDVRGNGGGNVSPMIIERLKRELTMYTISRNTVPSVDPTGMHVGPKVALINEFSMSDGDLFSYRFKKNKLGKTIGKRTWGGVVGIRGSLPFVDGGFLNRPEFSRYDIEATSWIIEGVGVEPDIEVDNDPALEYQGIDQQLNKAIELMKDELKSYKEIPPPPPYPDKSK